MAQRKTRGRVTAQATAKRRGVTRATVQRAKTTRTAGAARRTKAARQPAPLAAPAISTPGPGTSRRILGQKALRRLQRAHRDLGRRVSRLQRTARQTRRGLDRNLRRQRKELSRLRRSLRQNARSSLRQFKSGIAGFLRRTQTSARRALRNGVDGAATHIVSARRALTQGAARKLRHARDWMSRKAERKLYDAHATMQRTFRPVMQNVSPWRRTALAGGAAAVLVALISIGWLALFDRATAVPNRVPVPAEIYSLQPDNEAVPAPAKTEALPPVRQTPAQPSAGKSKVDRGAVPVPGRNAHKPRHSGRSTRQHRAEATAGDAFASAGDGDGNSLIAEARRYLGTNPTGRASLWCGAFMDLVLRKTGHSGGGNLALGYAHYGTRVSGPEIGAIAVMGRRGGGHVGVVSGIDPNGNPIVISGNHNRTVAEAVYPRQRIITYVMPN